MKLHTSLQTFSIILAFAFLFPLQSLGAEGRRFYFRNYDIKNGLSQNTVHSILQDSRGFIWLATKDGLNRFDGHVFRRVGIEDSLSSDSFTSTIFEDESGKLWVSTHRGPEVYDPVTESMQWFGIATGDGHRIRTEVTDFTIAPDGRLMMCADNDGVYAYNIKERKLEKIFSGHDIGANNVVRLSFAPGGRAYIGTFGTGLYYSDDNFATICPFVGTDGMPYFEGSVISAFKILGDKLYIGTDNRGLHVIDLRSNAATPVLVRDESVAMPYIRAIMFVGNSEIWLGTENGVYIYDIVAGKLLGHLTHNYFDKYSLSDNAIYSLMTDREGGVWIGSYFGGADYLGHKDLLFDKYCRTNSPGSLQAERVRELCRDGDGIIYVGSEDMGLSAFDPSSRTFSPVAGIPEKNIHGLCIDGRDLWVGTFAEGLRIKNLDTGKVRRYTVGDASCHGLTSDYIFTICRTLHGDIYIGTLSGMQRYRRDNDSFELIAGPQGFVYDIYEDSEGNLWAATYSEGLFVRNAGTDIWHHYTASEDNAGALPSNKVYGVQEDNKHNIWLMTQNGACVYNRASDSFDRSFAGIDRIKGVVYRMENDDQGRYWLSTNHGLYCIDTAKGGMRNFTTADGLPTNQFNYNSSLCTPEGAVYMGSIDGLVAFEPMRYTVAGTVLSQPVISEMYLHGERVLPGKDSPIDSSISIVDSINLEPEQNSFSFRITSLYFDMPGEQRIKYRMLGYSDEWQYAPADEAFITYSRLDYGNYRLQAAVCDEAGEALGPMLDLEVNIATPFWLSKWAMCIYTLIICGIICCSFFYYRRFSRLRNQRYLEHVIREKERESFESKIKFFTNVAHEIRTPLTLIKAPLDSVFRSKTLAEDADAKESLDVVSLNVDRLLLLANQLLDFRRMESGKFQIRRSKCDINALIESLVPRFLPTIESTGKSLSIDMPEAPVKACVDKEAITKILSNLFTNAIKYGKSYIRVSLTGGQEGLDITFANDGEVVAPDKREEIFSPFSRLESDEAGTGIGLSYARNLAQMHGGTLAMEDSTEENVFVLHLPYGEQDNAAEQERDKDASSTSDYMVKNSGGAASVLLVEDNLEMLGFIEKKLIAAGYGVLKACNGVEALAVLEENYIDIVVSDVMMPEMDGIELLGKLKNDISYSHIPVILLTAKTRMEDKLQGLDAGADAYIEKPFTVEYLLVTIGSQLRNRERMRQRLETMPLAKMPSKGLSKVDEEFLRKINDIIKDNFENSEFSMDDVITQLGMSRTTFYRKIKGMLDLSPNDYIKLQRLKRAAQLFQEGHAGVSEVCYMVGFSSPGYFTKCFQKQFGLSPKEFVASMNNKKS